MKKWLIYLLLLSICIYLVAAFIPADSGYVLISLGHTSIEMTFWMAAAIVLVTLLLCYMAYRIWRAVYLGTTGSLNYLLRGGERSARRRTAQGLLEYIEGDWKRAKKNLIKSVGKSPTPLINYLAAARSAYELGEHDEAMALLHSAEQQAPESTLAIALTQARMQLVTKKYEQCLAILSRVKNKVPGHPVVLDLMKKAFLGLDDWEGLEQLLPELRTQKNISSEELAQLQLHVSQTLLEDAGAQAKRKSTVEALEILQKAWQRISKDQRLNVDVIKVYVKLLIENSAGEVAASIIEKTIAKNWDNELVRLYGLIENADSKQQLVIAEAWLRQRPGMPVLMLTLGRLCLRNELWGKAKEYFEHSLQMQQLPESFAELARLHAHLGDHEKSTALYQQGLLLSTSGLPKLPMPHTH